jgi:hypothetical protein
MNEDVFTPLECQDASHKDAAADCAVDASGELTGLRTDAFYFGHCLGVSGSHSFSTSIVFLGDRRGQVDCFVQLSNQFVQVQLQIKFSWSRSALRTITAVS